jgi:peptidoglycan/LPS O-acetylase OafA/YrhL
MTLVDRTESGKNSLISIDLARAFAALSVFVYHYGIGHVLAERTGLKIVEGLAWPGAVFAVPLFFALSGFCIHGAEWHRFRRTGSVRFKEYFIRRARRIYPVYLLAIGISIAVNALAGKHDSGVDVLVHAFLLQGFSSTYFNTINLVLWTISIECCFYVICPLWLMLRIKRGLSLLPASGA